MATEELEHALAPGSIAELAEGLRGKLIAPGDPGYDEARAIWNGAHDRRPALIVRCAGVADVMRAVEFARSEGLPSRSAAAATASPASRPATAAS